MKLLNYNKFNAAIRIENNLEKKINIRINNMEMADFSSNLRFVGRGVKKQQIYNKQCYK